MCIRDSDKPLPVVPALSHSSFFHIPVSYTHLDVYKRQDLNHFIHLVYRFAYRKTTDSSPVGTFRSYKLGRLLTQVGINTSLHDRKKRLIITVFRFGFIKTLYTSVEPPMCQP